MFWDPNSTGSNFLSEYKRMLCVAMAMCMYEGCNKGQILTFEGFLPNTPKFQSINMYAYVPYAYICTYHSED